MPIQVICNGDANQVKSYWTWKVVSTPEEPNPSDLGQYRIVTLGKVMLEWLRLKYNATNPLITGNVDEADNIWLSLVPFMDFGRHQIVVKEGESRYERQHGQRYHANTDISIEVYARYATWGESFPQLENMTKEVQDVWMGYDPDRINGLHDVIQVTKSNDVEMVVTDNRNQTQDSTYIKAVNMIAIYEIERDTTLPDVAFVYDQANTAGSYATN